MASTSFRPCRRRLLGLAALGTALALLPGCAPRAPLRVAVHPWPGYQFLRLADQMGWLEGDGVELQPSRGFDESISALREGRIEAAALTLDQVLQLREAGVDLRVVLIFDFSAGADGLLVRPSVTGLGDLGGKRLGVEANSLGELMLRKALKAGGVARDAVEIVALEGDHLRAWEAQQPLDGLITYEPTLSRLRESQGLNNLFDSRELPLTIIDVLAVRQDSLDRHDGALRALVAAHFRALRQWMTNPIDTAYRLSPLVGLSPEEVPGSFRGIDLPDPLYNREYLSPPSTLLHAAARDLGQMMVEIGQLSAPPNLNNLFLADYLPPANA